MFLKGLRRLGEFRDVGADLLKRRHLAAAKFVPMSLVDTKQLDQEQHGIVFPKVVLLAPEPSLKSTFTPALCKVAAPLKCAS